MSSWKVPCVKGDEIIETREELEVALKKLAKANKLLSAGSKINEVCDQIQVDELTLKNWADLLSMPSSCGGILSNCHLLRSVVPIFSATPNTQIQHIGSGVLVKIGDELFVLTAAHVIDDGGPQYDLYMPAAEGIEQVTGNFCLSRASSGVSQVEVKSDIGYCRLSRNWNDKLHSSIQPLGVDDLLLTDDIETGNIFTFVGYPWRKTKSGYGKHETEMVTYSGHALSTDVYDKLGYSKAANILIRMRLRKTYSTLYSSHQPAPHPQGISGGGVISWPKNFAMRSDGARLKLAAIGHTFHSSDKCMAATHVVSLMMAIIRNNPSLAIHFIGHQACQEFVEYLGEIVALNGLQND